MDRRKFLKGLTAVPVVAALPAVGKTSTSRFCEVVPPPTGFKYVVDKSLRPITLTNSGQNTVTILTGTGDHYLDPGRSITLPANTFYDVFSSNG